MLIRGLKYLYYVHTPRAIRGRIALFLLKRKKNTIIEVYSETQTLFIHIPKAAGVSIINSLYGRNHKLVGHLYFNELYYLLNESSKVINVICFSRCPYTRLYSAYNFLKQGGMNEVDKNFSKRHLSSFLNFEDFVVNGLNKKTIRNYMHFEEQIKYIEGIEGKKNIKLHLKKFEDITFSYEELRNELCIGNKLLDLNVTKKVDNKLDITQKAKNIIKSVYKRDFEYFGYDYDG